MRRDRTNSKICFTTLLPELRFIGNPDWISVVGGVRGTRPPASDALLCLPVLWDYRRSFCDHARVLYMVIGLLIFIIYMCVLKI